MTLFYSESPAQSSLYHRRECGTAFLEMFFILSVMVVIALISIPGFAFQVESKFFMAGDSVGACHPGVLNGHTTQELNCSSTPEGSGGQNSGGENSSNNPGSENTGGVAFQPSVNTQSNSAMNGTY